MLNRCSPNMLADAVGEAAKAPGTSERWFEAAFAYNRGRTAAEMAHHAQKCPRQIRGKAMVGGLCQRSLASMITA
jgi:hypothetical protein